MKNLITILVFALITITYSVAQEDPYSDALLELENSSDMKQEPEDSSADVPEPVSPPEDIQEFEDSSAVITGDDEDGVSMELEEVIKEEEKDTTKIKLGDMDITIVEDMDKKHDWRMDDDRKGKKFKGHWAGFEMGFNNFVDEDYSLSRNASNQFMDLNTSRSWNVNINFHQASFGLIGKNFGLVTGLGLEFNNYFFDGNNSITKDSLGNIQSLPYDSEVSKSKLTATFLNMPVLLELQLGKGSRHKRINITAGIIGSVKLGSHTKVVYKENRKKEKDSGDFNINPLRFGLTARLGYGNLQVFGNYYLTSFFEKDKAPELYPVSVGLAFSFI